MTARLRVGHLRLVAWVIACLFVWLAVCTPALARPVLVPGLWEAVSGDGSTHPLATLPLTGGTFRHAGTLELATGPLVIDFRNSSVIGRFEHRLYASDGTLVATVRGGIQSAEDNPFFLRHGRELNLPAGRYLIVTDVESPFLLAQPEPYVDDLADYRTSINVGNALVLLCLGVFVGLGFYCTCLGVMRRRRVHVMYALFILGNLLYNAAALLVWHDLVAPGWFYLVSAPILLSNIAYVTFVLDLLEIRASDTPRLHAAGIGVRLVLAALLVVGVLHPSWSLQMDRYGVAVFLLFGFAVGLAQAFRGSVTARLYLVANAGFFASGLASISLSGMAGVFFVYVEHLGLVAVTIEVLMLSFVLSYQFGLLQREREGALRDREIALREAEASLRLAHTDGLTGLPNRTALESALSGLSPQGGLSFIDLDGLKHYNDTFGHGAR